nr:hypothetical protein [uncultured Roseococcus sp.]
MAQHPLDSRVRAPRPPCDLCPLYALAGAAIALLALTVLLA